MITRAFTAWLLLSGTLSLAGAGCYRPDILDGGFGCAEAGKLCPDGFVCNSTDHLCHRVGAPLPDAAACMYPAVATLCGDPAPPGQNCNPTCQTGCSCGRCNVGLGGVAECTAVGTKKLGELCTLGMGD